MYKTFVDGIESKTPYFYDYYFLFDSQINSKYLGYLRR